MNPDERMRKHVNFLKNGILDLGMLEKIARGFIFN